MGRDGKGWGGIRRDGKGWEREARSAGWQQPFFPSLPLPPLPFPLSVPFGPVSLKISKHFQTPNILCGVWKCSVILEMCGNKRDGLRTRRVGMGRSGGEWKLPACHSGLPFPSHPTASLPFPSDPICPHFFPSLPSPVHPFLSPPCITSTVSAERGGRKEWEGIRRDGEGWER